LAFVLVVVVFALALVSFLGFSLVAIRLRASSRENSSILVSLPNSIFIFPFIKL